MNISSVLKENQIIFDLDVSTREEAIKQLSNIFLENNIIEDKDEYVKAVLEREAHSTTGIGNGISIPHGKSSTVKKSSIIFAKSKNKIEWESLDDKPVEKIFLLAISDADKDTNHLVLLSKLAQQLMDDESIEALNEAKTPKEIIKIFS